MKNYIKTLIKKAKKRSKRPFQLLEVMIAAFILLICIAPVMKIMTSMYLSEQEVVRENQRDHLARLIHGKITEMLYKNQIKIQLEENRESTPVLIGNPEIETLLKNARYSSVATMTAIVKRKPKGVKHHKKFLVKLVIQMKDESVAAQKKAEKIVEGEKDPRVTEYDYLIYIDAGAKNESSDDDNEDDDDDEEDVIADADEDDDDDFDDDDDDFDDDDDDFDDDDDDFDDDDDDDDDDEDDDDDIQFQSPNRVNGGAFRNQDGVNKTIRQQGR